MNPTCPHRDERNDCTNRKHVKETENMAAKPKQIGYQYDLINSLIHNEWDIILLQEPYIDTLGSTRANHHWRVIYPSDHLANTTPKRSVILVNTKLDTNSWSQVLLSNTNDITIIQIKHPQGKVTIFNIYNDCNHSNSMTMVDKLLRNGNNTILWFPTNSLLWCGDFNRHHPMWEEE